MLKILINSGLKTVMSFYLNEKMVNKILVAIDGSEQADVALKKSLEIAKKEGAKVTILHVVGRRLVPLVPYPYTSHAKSYPWLMGRPGINLPFGYPI